MGMLVVVQPEAALLISDLPPLPSQHALAIRQAAAGCLQYAQYDRGKRAALHLL
jgi:hypothetical protein